MSCARPIGGLPYVRVNVRPPSTVPEVIARLRALESSPSRSDGVACFARLYREVTEGVNAELGRHTFANAHFLERLDVRFANLFFAALDEFDRAPAGARFVVKLESLNGCGRGRDGRDGGHGSCPCRGR